MAQVGAIIVAAGSSARMGGIDKLFAPLAGIPVLARTLTAFQESPLIGSIVVVLSADNLARGRGLVTDGCFSKVGSVCAGGARRQDSVRLGLEALPPCEWVAVHDGARPLISPDIVALVIAAAQVTGAALPALPVTDTLKEAAPGGRVLRTLGRSKVWAAQTPQVFRRSLLEEAHRRVTTDVTDDSAMVEALGGAAQICPGSPLNIKITSPEDLALAEAILAAGAQAASALERGP